MLFSTDLRQLGCVSERALAFVSDNDLMAVELGRHDLGGGEFVNVMEYDTKLRKDAAYESHEELADIQMVISGAEYLEVAPTADLTVTTPYTADGDYALYDGAHEGERFLMLPGRFCLVMPEDAHMPGVTAAQGATPVRKAVFKVPVSAIRAAFGA